MKSLYLNLPAPTRVLVSRLISSDSSLSWGNGIGFLGKTLNSHSASLHQGVQIGASEFNTGGNPVMD